MGDTVRARVARGAARALEGLDAWKVRGDHEEARRILEEVQTGALFDEWQENRTLRWWLADLLTEMGEYVEAARYYRSLAYGAGTGLYDPPAALRLGKVYEQLGEAANAREAYAWLLLAWRDADPALRPWLDDASQGLERTSALSR
jgi:tetratricopeptide (TPR) repeat protein